MEKVGGSLAQGASTAVTVIPWLATLFIVRKTLQDPHTAPQLACHPLNTRPGQSSLSAGALRDRAWAQSWRSAVLAARSVLPSAGGVGSLHTPGP